MRTFSELVGRWNVDLVDEGEGPAGEWDFEEEPVQPAAPPQPAPAQPAAAATPAASAPARRPGHWWNETLAVPLWAVIYICAAAVVGIVWIVGLTL